MHLKNVSIEAEVDLYDHIDDIENFIKINKDHPEIISMLDDIGFTLTGGNKAIVKAISDCEYCHLDKDKLIEEIKQLVQYNCHKYEGSA